MCFHRTFRPRQFVDRLEIIFDSLMVQAVALREEPSVVIRFAACLSQFLIDRFFCTRFKMDDHFADIGDRFANRFLKGGAALVCVGDVEVAIDKRFQIDEQLSSTCRTTISCGS